MQRKWIVGWLYLVAVGHFVGALMMTWGSAWSAVTAYHQHILAAFGFTLADSGALALQQWWMALFGATLQVFSLLLFGLIYLGNRARNPLVWSGLALAILFWVPQDIVISLQKNAWAHLWVDLFAVMSLVVPLLLLWNQDRKPVEGKT